MKHARELALDYLASMLEGQTETPCAVHRIGLAEQRLQKHLEIYIDGEQTSGTDEEDELEAVMGLSTRVAVLFVKITVKDAEQHPDIVANELTALVEIAMAGENSDGSHMVDGGQVDCSYAGFERITDDQLESEATQYEMAYALNYRTPSSNPYKIA